MTDSPHRPATLLKVVGAVASAMLILAASCERKPPTTPDTLPGTTGATTSTTGGTTGEATLQPTDAGPRAPAIFMLSGLKGYTEPCGCTLDIMLGGIDRIAGYVEAARPLYDDVYVISGGDLLFEHPKLEEHEIPQEKAKVDTVVQGLRKIGVKLATPGANDFALGGAYYLEKIAAAGITPIAANLAIDGKALPAMHTKDNRLFVGVVNPELYTDVANVTATDPHAALAALNDEIAAADVAVLIVQGDVAFGKEMLAAVPKADFALIGQPRETDQVDQLGGGFTLEPYDQGRYLGILKLYNTEGAAAKTFTDARPTSKAELDKIERQIEHVNDSINKMPPATPNNEPPMLRTLRERLATLNARVEEIKNAAIDVPDDAPAFLWRSIALEPGLPIDPSIEAARNAYNAELKRLNSSLDRDIIPVAHGEAQFIGTDNCATCHQEAKTFWDGTAHARAWATLVERDKDFDQKCVGCHVVGYDQPGGSVIGKFQYEFTMPVGTGERTMQKDLVNVGCESCHGPGSLHFASPIGADGAPQHIIADPTEQQCSQCHVPEHSPRFRFDVFVNEITGEGHARSE